MFGWFHACRAYSCRVQLEKEAADNVEKAEKALDALRTQEAGLLSKMERVETSQLLMVQKKRELARLASDLEVS